MHHRPHRSLGAPSQAFDVEFGPTTKWDGDQLTVISAFWAPLGKGSRSASLSSAGRRPARSPVRCR